VLDEEAGVFNDEEAGGAGFCSGTGIGDALLEPENFGADGDGGIGDGRNAFGTAEDIHDVNGFGDVLEARIGFLAEDLGFVGVDGDDFVADGLEIRGDFMRRAARIRGEADDSNCFGGAEDVGDGVGGLREEVGEVEVHQRVG